MIRRVYDRTAQMIPKWLLNWIKSNSLAQRFARFIVSHTPTQINTGAGAGLLIQTGQSNPAYGIGSNEQPVQMAVKKHLNPGDVFYDIGANVGFFTIIAARCVGQNGRVIAFEPVPENVALIRKNIRLNNSDNVEVIQKAVSSVSGEGELLLSHYSGGSVLSEIDSPPPDLKDSISIDIVSIDELVRNGDIPAPTLVKIDVEGAEHDVLLGMRETIQKHQPVVIYEVDDSKQESLERKKEQCATFFSEMGYQVQSLEDSYPEIGWLVYHAVARPS